MFVKECKELARSYKLLFVPIVFALLGLGQPVALKLLPLLMQSASNLPPGSVIQIPTPAPGAVVAGIVGQFSQMGVLVLVLVSMGAIAGERLSGVAATVLAKPVGRGAYLAAKAAALGLLAAASVALGLGLGAYYTQVLLGPVNWVAAGLGTLLDLPNLLLPVAVTLAFSAFLPSPLAAGGAGIATVIGLNLVPRYLGAFLAGAYPGALSASAARVLVTGTGAALRPLAAVLLLILAALAGGWWVLEQQEI